MLYSFDREHPRTTYAHRQRGSMQKKEHSMWEGGKGLELRMSESNNEQLNLVKLISYLFLTFFFQII